MTALQGTPAPCRRCEAPDAPFTLRSLPTCRSCIVDYVESKIVKRLGILTKETRTSTKPVPRRYLAGLSFGPSSSVLTHLLDKTAEYHASRKASSPFEPLVVHVDTHLLSPPAASSASARLLARFRRHFPHVAFECVPLTQVLSVKTIDWSALPALAAGDDDGDGRACDDASRLRRFFDALPSVSSRADVLRLFVRHLLLHVARERGNSALLLGHNATALASLALAEVASGRGFAVPSEVNDGQLAVCTYERSAQGSGTEETSRTQFPVYYPVREVLKNEVETYLDLVPALKDLVPSAANGPVSVVSHKDLSIEEVMSRYFDSIEGPHSGIIANVVRITGKLDRSAGSAFCRLCGIALDEHGDSRWAGELGDIEADGAQVPSSTLCYGCRRSVNG